MILLTDDSWEIKTTQKKGRGIYAKKNIAAGIVIGDYIGKVLKTAEDDTHETDEGLYLMYYHNYASLYPTDIKAPGIHLINHSCEANCWMYIYQGHTLFFSLRHIFKGEELTTSYLLNPDMGCDPCTHVCKCDSMLCSSTMHLSQDRFEKWSKFSEEQAKKTKRTRIRYGRELSKLISYPDIIPDHPIYNLFGSSQQPFLTLDNKKLPSIQELRKVIRETGRTMQFPKLKTRILGIENDTIVSEAMKLE
jgi:hypothetical protein